MHGHSCSISFAEAEMGNGAAEAPADASNADVVKEVVALSDYIGSHVV